MKTSGYVIAVGAILALLLLSKSGNAAAPNGSLSLNDLSDRYGQDAINRLNALYAEMLSRGYSDQQILFMLSQILFETGLFTDAPNFHLMNQNNYAGLTAVSGGYAAYNSISDFLDAYDGFLSKGSDPLGANNLTDFNNRLLKNHYYTENPGVYYNGLLSYYNLLNSL